MNSAGTWATVTSGISFSQFENVLGVLDVPAMSKNTFLKKEVEVEKVWLKHIDNALVEAGIEERRLAIEKGDVDDGMPFITVIVDGGWSKRSYGHNYTATSGMAVIIAERTGQLLFLGVRNKYCCICDRATKIGMEAKPHLCYKNWDENKPSTAMEQDINVEGFKMSEKMHGVRYKYFVGDGDSSVYAKLVQNVSYGRTIQKLECANHCIKNYTGHLHKLAADKTFPPDSRKLLKQSIPRLTAAARGAIRHCADEGETVDDSISDLKNWPYHVFGEHAQCRNYFCQKVESNENLKIITNAKLLDEITALVSRLEQKAPRLIKNKTSNAAEFYMSLLAKYNCGKRINLGQRGSFQRRCYVAGSERSCLGTKPI
ncbi:uncharacterized protein LOC134540255 [Bacillus rossius redtenbacheri]|uniref:uncharacterized protein LOC134540255 n=1 Tax=Bacillus rossius redtenbacheri TaxID=93214 RepID=UPI002FDC7E33